MSQGRRTSAQDCSGEMLVGDLGRAPTKNWGPIPGGRDAWNPPPYWQLGCVSGTPGTHSEVPTHCNQHMPLKGVLQLPLNGHLEAQGRSGACQKTRFTSASLSRGSQGTARLQPECPQAPARLPAPAGSRHGATCWGVRVRQEDEVPPPEDTQTQPTCDKGENALHEGVRLARGILPQSLGRGRGLKTQIPSLFLHRPSCHSFGHTLAVGEGPSSRGPEGLDTCTTPMPNQDAPIPIARGSRLSTRLP